MSDGGISAQFTVTKARLDRFEHAAEILGDVGIPEAKDGNTTLSEPLIAGLVADHVARLVVLAAVQLNREPQGGTIEVERE